MKAAVFPLIGASLISASPTLAQNNTSGQWTYNVNASNEATIIGYTGSGGAVSIPATIDGYPVKTVGGGGAPSNAPIFGALNGSVTSVSIPQGVTNIGVRAFAYCTNLQSVNIASSVLTISLDAFGDCPRLTNISLAEGLQIIDQGAFLRCKALTVVSIPTSVTNIGAYAFAGCVSMQSTKIPHNVNYLGYRAFQGCSNMASVIIGRQVDTIRGEVFSDCANLSAVMFLGNAPSTVGSNFFGGSAPTFYRMSEASGWSDSFLGFPVEVFSASPTGSAPLTSNSFSLTWNGPTNVPLNVQRSTSLNGPWTVVSSNNFAGEFTDTNPPVGRAFYRAVVP